jgi:hypothetical protein
VRGAAGMTDLKVVEGKGAPGNVVALAKPRSKGRRERRKGGGGGDVSRGHASPAETRDSPSPKSSTSMLRNIMWTN